MRRRVALLSAAATLSVLFFAGSPSPAVAGTFEAVVLDDKGAPIADAIVAGYPLGAAKANGEKPREIVDQVDSEFVPEVKAVRVGTEIVFPNKDNTRHHVYSFSRPKKFELPLYKGVPADPVLFDKPGLVVLGCNIHDWMVGYVYVLETPYFAKTGRDGKATLAALPPGEYEMRVYHPRAKKPESPAASLKASVGSDAAAATEFRLTLLPDTRRNRASRPNDPTYP